jgi:hypothetical protein
MAVCCQNLTLGAPSSRSALSVLVGALFKKFGTFLSTPRMSPCTVKLATFLSSSTQLVLKFPNSTPPQHPLKFQRDKAKNKLKNP